MFRQPTSTRFVVSLRLFLTLCAVAVVLAGVVYNRRQVTAQSQMPQATPDGPDTRERPIPHQTGNATAGRDVFRFETFGNEGFWTDAVRLPKGVKDAKLTPRVPASRRRRS